MASAGAVASLMQCGRTVVGRRVDPDRFSELVETAVVGNDVDCKVQAELGALLERPAPVVSWMSMTVTRQAPMIAEGAGGAS